MSTLIAPDEAGLDEAFEKISECRRVLLKDGGKIQSDVRMVADALVIQHLGDKF